MSDIDITDSLRRAGLNPDGTPLGSSGPRPKTGAGMYNLANFVTEYDVFGSENPFVAPDVPVNTAPDVPFGTAPDVPFGTAPDVPVDTAPNVPSSGVNFLDTLNQQYATDYNNYLSTGQNETSWVNSPKFQDFENKVISGIDNLYDLNDYDRVQSDFNFHSARSIADSPYAGSSSRIAGALQNKLNFFNAIRNKDFGSGAFSKGGMVSYNNGIKSLF
tara:strand:+ start:220 stop:870 length:651 start_codon:yes stop_codon:yes gene_type:complete